MAVQGHLLVTALHVPCGNAQEAVDAIVAVNHATGLRYMRDEDHTVGTWVSPMHLKYLSGDDIGLFFWPWGLHDGYITVG